tara:strand:+ start:662 stop:895 length:234 start_codon:yes stop_codon:yes gene_type:complete
MMKERTLIMAQGTVKWFNATKGYGFIEPADGGKDVFVHINAVERSGLSGLQDGEKVSFELETDPKRGKTSAVNLSIS